MIKLLTILLLISSTSFSQKDYSRDKHMIVSSALTIGITEITFQLTKKQGLSLGVGVVSAWTIGYIKEAIWDKKLKKGTYSNWDIADNSWGIATAIPVMIVRFDLYNKKQQELIYFE